MESTTNFDNIIEGIQHSDGRTQLKQACQNFCQYAEFEHYLLFGSVFTSLLSPPCYIINSPGKATRLKKDRLDEIIQSCIASSTPVIRGNIDKDSLAHKTIFNVNNAPASQTLSISFPIHFPLGNFAFLHIATRIHKREINNKLMSTLATGNLFAREAGISIIRELESELENKPPYLSLREKECLLLASEGISPKAISEQVGLSSHTVIFYLKKAREKLNSKNIQGAVGKAMLRGDIKTLIGSENN